MTNRRSTIASRSISANVNKLLVYAGTSSLTIRQKEFRPLRGVDSDDEFAETRSSSEVDVSCSLRWYIS